jgi:hypothetical protein
MKMATKKSKKTSTGTKTTTASLPVFNEYSEVMMSAAAMFQAFQTDASRDKFAEVAMGKLLEIAREENDGSGEFEVDAEAISADAFKLADAMMKARAPKQ